MGQAGGKGVETRKPFGLLSLDQAFLFLGHIEEEDQDAAETALLIVEREKVHPHGAGSLGEDRDLQSLDRFAIEQRFSNRVGHLVMMEKAPHRFAKTTRRFELEPFARVTVGEAQVFPFIEDKDRLGDAVEDDIQQIPLLGHLEQAVEEHLLLDLLSSS